MPIEQRYRRKTGETREETRTTERKRNIANLAYLAEHRVSIVVIGGLDFNSLVRRNSFVNLFVTYFCILRLVY